MENQEDSVEETWDHAVHQKNTNETERRSVAELNIPATVSASWQEGKAMNAFRASTSRENKGILKETSASGSYSEEVDGDATEKGNKSARENEGDAMVMRRQVTSTTNGTRGTSSQHESTSSNRRQMKSMGKIGARRRQRPFCDIIGTRERRREELEKVQGDLRQRLGMLESSMPAVMAWNICRMTQGASACRIRRVLEEQFKAASELPARSTPSCHYDCRVREVEAERKLALKKVEEARALWTEKLQALEERKRKLEEARRVQEEQKNTMEQLNKEIEALREATEKVEAAGTESCRHGECGDKRCSWLAKMPSVTSIESGDIECLEKLQQLAAEELIIKKDIAELERREDAYMRTLQRADELWSKVEDDRVSSTSALQEQLDAKTAANQQLADRVCELEDALERCRARMAACRTELEKFLSIEKLEAAIGREDDVAEVTDKAVAVRAKVTHRPIGRPDDVAIVKDDEVLARIEAADEEVLAVVIATDADVTATLPGDDKYISVKPESADLAVDRQVDLVPVTEEESAVRPEDFDYEQRRFEEVQEYLAQLDSLEELYEDDGEPCPPDFVCNGVVTSPTGMTDEELIAMGVEPTEVTEQVRKLAAKEKERKREETMKITDVIDRRPRLEIEKKVAEGTEERAADDKLITMPEVRRFDADQDVVIKRDELLSWIDKIDMIRAKIARYPELQAVRQEADILVEQIGAHVGVKPKEVVIDEAKTKLDEDKIKYAPEVPTELPKIDPTEKMQVKPVPSPDIITETTEVYIKRAMLEDKSMVAEDVEVELEPKIPSTPIPYIEEVPVEADLAKEEISVELPTVVSIETPQVHEIEVDDEKMKSVEEEKFIDEKAERKEEEITAERAERIAIIIKPEIKEPSEPSLLLEEAPAKADLKEEITAVPSKPVEPSKPIPIEIEQIEVDDAIKPVDEEPLIVQQVKEEEERTIPEYAEKIEIKVEDLPKEEIIEKEAEPRAEIIKLEKEVIEPADAEEAVPTADVKEAEELTVDEVPPRVDLIEVEEPKPSELPIAAEAPSISEVEEAIKQPALEVEITKVRDEKVEEAPLTVVPRAEEEEKLPSIKKEELPARVPTLPEPTIEAKWDEVALLEGKFHVFEAFEVEEKILIVKAKPSEAAKVPTAPIEPRPPPAKPYFVFDRRTKFEERELLHVISEATKPPSTTTRASPVEELVQEVGITTRSGVVEAELITEARLPIAEGRAPSAQIISEYFKLAELEANAELAGGRPEITGRKIPWRKRLKDQSTVTTSSAGSQTDKTSHVSHDRIERERARLTTDELLRSIKIAARLTRGDTEREIRTINYGTRASDDGTATRSNACNCCLCGNATSSSSSTRPKLPMQPQVAAKTATPLVAALKRAFVPLKTDHVIPYDRLCSDCKTRIQGRIMRDKGRAEQISQERENYVSSVSTGTWCRAVPRKRTVEKKDQSCLAKMPKQKTADVAEQRKQCDPPTPSPQQTDKTDVEPLTPSCICFQLEKPSVGPMRKGNCYCAD